MEEIKIFNHKMFGEIRAMTAENGEVLFVGKDVATALGYSNTRDAMRKHVDEEDKTTALIQGPLGGTQKMTIINESGLYALILSSKLHGQQKARTYLVWTPAGVRFLNERFLASDSTAPKIIQLNFFV